MDIGLETKIVTLTIDETLQNEIDKLVKEGWQLMPHVPPVGVYHLARVKGATMPTARGFGRMQIDDSKVFVRRANGQIERSDGTIVEEEK